MRKSNFSFLSLLGLTIFIILAGLGFVAMQSSNFNLDFRKQASGEQLDVTLGNSSTKIQPNQAITVDLMVNTKGKFVSGFQFSGTITGINQDKTGVVISQLTGLNSVFSEVNKVGSDLQFKFVELAALGTNAFTTHDQNQKLVTFNLYPTQTGEVKITFDQNSSGAMEFGKSFLSSSLKEQKYNVEVTTATGGTSNAPADAGIHRSCNEYCADSRECATQYSCWYNRCRNPKNVQEEKCTDPVIVQPSPIATTVKTTPASSNKGGSTPTPTPTPASKTTVATVIITTASSSAKTATPSATPLATPKISTSSSTKNLGTSPSPSPSPAALANTSQSSSSLGLLIGAAIVTGILAFGAIIFFLKNRATR